MSNKICTKCGQKYPATTKYFPTRQQSKDKLDSWCRNCYRCASKAYRAIPNNHSKHLQNNCIWYAKHKSYNRQQMLKWSRTLKGQEFWAKVQTRRRKLGWVKAYKNIINEPIEWHHINNKNVVAVPKDLHKLYGGLSQKYHRFMVNQIVKQLYNGKSQA